MGIDENLFIVFAIINSKPLFKKLAPWQRGIDNSVQTIQTIAIAGYSVYREATQFAALHIVLKKNTIRQKEEIFARLSRCQDGFFIDF